MKNGNSLESWLEAAIQAVTEVAGSALACDVVATVREGGLPPTQSGAYLPMLAAGDSVYLGLLSDRPGLTQITRSLLGMEPAESDPAERDVADAVSEIANMIGGGVQRRLADPDFAVELGLPIFVKGEVMMEDLATASAALDMGGTAVEVVILHGGRRLEGAKS